MHINLQYAHCIAVYKIPYKLKKKKQPQMVREKTTQRKEKSF
jgi:hypothetical protein